MGIDSKPISQQRVYAQSEAPQGRDGILWVDTSEEKRPTKVFSSETGTWEKIAPSEREIKEMSIIYMDGFAPNLGGQ